ncbi:methylmalonyl-CoA mutase family protein [Lutibacter sp.]|uniref:methylmalonyl-CoA mutase family protein n=1 Tax=Lutibacter sp. TaxID=1925666 RepID=UPI001A29B1EA|nr:methylmalonyl-CoA mutase family protein [Lutibacter sp.]MBI9040496.1 methylmalonyl-CoA mutase [Lutibacter sp.]
MSNFFTNEFQPSSSAAWKQKIQFELDGADYNQTLLTKTNEGITIKPFYHSDSFEKIQVPIIDNTFKICQSVTILNEETANNEAVKAINKGVNTIQFKAAKPFSVKTVFQNLLHKNVEFHFSFSFLSETFLQDLCKTLNTEIVYLNIDIIGNLAKTGNWYSNLTTDFNTLENILKTAKPNFVISVNSEIYQNAGANSIQQIAYALAHANEYLNKFGGNIAAKIQFKFALGSNYFFEIAKIRAFRYLYQLICEQYNTNCSAQVFVEPSFRNKTSDSYNNHVQRVSTEFMSGIIGGANTISNNSNNKSCLQNLVSLKEEFLKNNIQEITEGNYYIESLTKQIAEKALDIFKEIEKSGGFLHQLKEGIIQRKIAENAKKEQNQFNTGELILVGSNKFKNNVEKATMFKETSTLKNYRQTLIIPIIAKRLAAKLEQK